MSSPVGRTARMSGLAVNRPIAPTTPSGASQSTTSSSAPTNSRRYWARENRNSGNRTTTTAPINGPRTVPDPPIITTSRNRMDWKNGKDSGLMKLVIDAKTAPARPARTADSAKAMVRIQTRLSPRDWPAISESRTARMARPHGLAFSLANRTIAMVVKATTNRAMSRSSKECPKAPGVGMFMIPFQPPVTSLHSAALCSTTKPNAMVTMAR